MTTNFKSELSKIMKLAWQMVKRNGFTMSEALKKAWANIKLKARMHNGIVKFHFQKVDGLVREAYGTLVESYFPAFKGDARKANDTLTTYYDTEKQGWRCFKVANLIY